MKSNPIMWRKPCIIDPPPAPTEPKQATPLATLSTVLKKSPVLLPFVDTAQAVKKWVNLLVLIRLTSLYNDGVTGKYTARGGQGGRDTAVKLSELILLPADLIPLAADLKSAHICNTQEIHNGEGSRTWDRRICFTCIEDDLLSIVHL